MSIEAIVNEFSAVAANPKGQLKAYKDAGKKCIGVMPYYAPEELVYAAGMMPFGMWGSNNKTEQRSKEYCATFYCTIAQLDLEMLLDGTMDLLDGVITPTICDTLRPMSQNIRVAMSEKLPCIFLAHPQNRFADWGKQFAWISTTTSRPVLKRSPVTRSRARTSLRPSRSTTSPALPAVSSSSSQATTATLSTRSCARPS